MAADSQGTAHVFGAGGGGSFTSATVVSFSSGHEYDLNEQVYDENGVTTETRRDDRVKRVNARLRFLSNFNIPDLGELVTLANMKDADFNDTYEVTRKGNESQSRGFSEVGLDLTAHEGITYA